MADIRIKDLPTTATQTASDDFIALDGTVNGTRKIDASAPSFKTSVTSPSVVAPAATALTLTGGSTGASVAIGQGTTAASTTITPTGTGNLLLQTNAQTPTTGIFQINNTTAAPVWQAFTSGATTLASLSRSGNALLIKGGGATGAQVSIGYTGEDLTLTGGSTGASLVLGQGTTAGDLTFTPTGSATAGTFLLSRRTSNAATLGTISYGADSTSINQGTGYFHLVTNSAIPLLLGTNTAERARLTTTGNLLIGTTSDAANLSGGLVVNGSGSGAAATGANNNTGALRVTGGVGVSGAGYFGGSLNAVQGNFSDYVTVARTGSAKLILTNNTASKTWEANAFSDSKFYITEIGGDNWFSIANTTGRVNLASTTSASSSTVGALTIGNGTAATNVAIGGGFINAGQSITAGGSIFTSSSLYVSSGNRLFFDYGVSNSYYAYKNGTTLELGAVSAVNVAIATEATTSAGVGALTTAGGIHAAKRIVSDSTEASTGSTSGSGIFAGGIYAGAASVFGGQVSITKNDLILSLTSATGTSANYASFNNTGGSHYIGTDSSAGGSFFSGLSTAYSMNISAQSGRDLFIGSGAKFIKMAHTTGDLTFPNGAATFAGAVTTTNGTITANAGTGFNTFAGSNTSATGFGAYFRGGGVQGSGKYLLQLVNYDASKNYLFYDDIATFPGAATFAGAVTMGGNLTLPAAAAATTRYILSAANNDGTIVFQNGVGSAATGGSLQLSGSTHATRPGWVTVGLGSGSTRKFTVSDSGTPGGTDVFTVDATGNSVFAGVVIKKNYTVATLPAAASYTYGEAYVSDATQAAGTSLGSAPTGGGSVKRGVYSDGTSWLLR